MNDVVKIVLVLAALVGFSVGVLMESVLMKQFKLWFAEKLRRIQMRMSEAQMTQPTAVSIILNDLRKRQHLDAYVAILISIVLAVLGLLGVVRFEVLAAGILLAMSFVVWIALANRHALAQVIRSIEEAQVTGHVLKFSEFPDRAITQKLREAKEISVSGIDFWRFFPLYLGDIEHALRRGARLRVILADPDSAAAEMASFRSDIDLSPENVRRRILTTIDLLREQQKRIVGNQIGLRKYPYLAPYAIIIITPSDSHAQRYYHARILPFRSSSLRGPIVVPEASDKEWTQFIESQFEGLWVASSDVDLNCVGELRASARPA